MRTLYDAVTAAHIPSTAAMVAGYIDKIKLAPWTAADWARFPDAVKVEIVKKATTNAGHVLDVEPGDATPAEAPAWVRLRRAAGADPTIYCNAATWPAVRAAFRAAGVAEPHYWIARFDGDPAIPAGAVAKQYRGDVAPGYDVSSVAGHWPGVDPDPRPTTSEEVLAMLAPAASDDYVSIPCDGRSSLFVAAHFGRKVTAIEIWAIGDSPADPARSRATFVGGGFAFDPDRPGPIRLPPNTRTVNLRYQADHAFTGWCS
ncbi:hypothetical protein [Amycolatopsis sp. WQ 127309]|uniref:hypothetical protein n=1 Tax=Amycolatopsis sp. WQ 127309 TaxID=2932773 RepID=UPI001FF6BF5E|nr:hypothetical protein [Amycolatopsis sp. WQ 127309]UOZ05439.1 hypothetical protein MUY22_42505 [Amycolatopsis sp. WQ 127309]